MLFLVFVFAGIAFAQTWVEMQILTASNKAANDYFGRHVTLTDNYALVGAYLADPGGLTDAGAAYVFVRSGTTWTEQAILTASNKAANDYFGWSVSLTDNYALVGAWNASPGAIGAAGAAYVFVRSGPTWIEQAILSASNKAANDYFGDSVSLINDKTALIAPKSSLSRTYTFTRDGTTWTQSAISNTCCPQPVTQTANFKIQGENTANVGGFTQAGRAIVFLNSARDVLTRMYTETGGQNWVNKNGWNSDQPICSWFGVVCDSSCRPLLIKQNSCPVLVLQLDGNSLQGTIPTLNLPDIVALDLANNQLSGTIPNLDMMPRLTNLSLSNNQLSGTIPNFDLMPRLTNLSLSNNQLSGFIPLFPPSLKTLDISGNTGLLYRRDVLQQLFDETQGSRWINRSGWLRNSSYCSWHGIECHSECPKVQHELESCPIYRILLDANNLTGTLSSRVWMDAFQELRELNISNNQLSGTIPNLNMKRFLRLDLSNNNFTGSIPNLPMMELTSLRLNDNKLTGSIPDVNSPVLAELYLHNNKVSGTLPAFNMPFLVDLFANNNQLTGTIPNLNAPQLVNMNFTNNQLSGQLPNFLMPDLKVLNIANNELSGTLPNFEHLGNLIQLDISNNKITGSLPKFLFPDLEWLNIENNQLNGAIPDITTPRLLHLKFGHNNLSGTIPRLLMSLLVEMDLKCNSLSGNIPSFTMPLMKVFDLSANQLSGTIPDFTMTKLEHLNLERNNLSGTIPKLIMPVLVSAFLSFNQLSGTIPPFESSQLRHLMLDSNNLEGNIPVFPASLQSLNLTNNPSLIYPQNVLREMYHEMDGDEWRNKTGWLENEDVCSWHGVSCDAKCPKIQLESSMCPITGISLAGNKLSGSLASGTWLSGLRDLEEINLESNYLTGTIPKLNMPGLLTLNLNGNQLTGALPEFNLPKVAALYLAKNELTGFSETFDLPSLTILDLSSNQLQGALPPFFNANSLVRLDLSFNKLNAISQLNLPDLQTLLLSNNRISGSLPNLNLPQLAYLDLSNNNLDETLPDWLSLVNLEHFIISSNQNLTGPLPKGMDGFNKISTVDIKNTKMHRKTNNLLPKTLNPSGQYQMLNPADNYQCPILANLNVSRSNIVINPEYYDFYNCRCLPATFGVRNKCISCPSSCNCNTGLELKGCFPSPSLENMITIIPCSNPSACETLISSDVVLEISSTQQEADSCLDGYEGRVCSKCKPGFGAQGRSCVECESSLVYALFVIGPVLIVCFIVYLFKSKSETSGKLGILIFHTQTLSVIATAMSNTPAVERSASIPFSVSSIQLPSLSCAFGTTDALTPIAASFVRLPILALIGILSFKATSGHTRDKVVFVFLNLARCMYYPIALETFGVFSCTLFDKGYDAWFLNAWPWISCDPATHEYENMLALAIPTFLIFVCGFPVLLWYIIRDNLHNVNQKRDEEERKSRKTRYGFLYLPYQKEYQFWSIVMTGRLLCFGLVIRIVPYTSLAVIFILLLVLMQGSIWVQHIKSPFLAQEENVMELVSLYTIFLSYFLVLISGFVGNSSWIIGLVIGLNGLVLGFLLWKTLGNSFLGLFGKKQKVSVMVSSARLPSVIPERSSMSVSLEMKNVAPTEN